MDNLPIDTAPSLLSISPEEIEEELKQSNVLQREYNQALMELTLEVKTFQEKLASKGDITAIRAVVDEQLSRFNTTLKEYPKGRTFRVLFFPECNPREYYRLIWIKLMAWLFLITAIWVLFRLGMTWLSVDYQKDRYKQAWDKIYSIQSKVHQQEMDRMLDQ